MTSEALFWDILRNNILKAGGRIWEPFERFSDRLDDPPAPGRRPSNMIGRRPPAAEHDWPPAAIHGQPSAAEHDRLPLTAAHAGRPHDRLTPRRIPPPVLATFLLQNQPQSI